MAFPQVQIVGSDGLVIGASGQATPAGTGFSAVVPTSNVAVAATTAFVSAKVGAGRYFGMTANTTGGGTIVVSDGSGGAVIGGMTSVATSNGVPLWVGPSTGIGFTSGLVVLSTTSSPAVVVHFS